MSIVEVGRESGMWVVCTEGSSRGGTEWRRQGFGGEERFQELHVPGDAEASRVLCNVRDVTASRVTEGSFARVFSTAEPGMLAVSLIDYKCRRASSSTLTLTILLQLSE